MDAAIETRPDAAAAVALVRVKDLRRSFGGVVAVDGAGFEVRRGEMFGLIGPDGAGKTTTLRTILGLLPPDAGTVETCGCDPWKRRAELSRRIGYLSQRFSLYGDLSVDENVAFFAEIHGVRGWKPRRDELLETLRLAPFRGRLAERLSGGMKQKLALACTLVHTPELLVLDEPTTGVDPVSRREFWKILARLQRDGLTLLLTTPYLDEAERCQRVALMDRGRILEIGSPVVLRERNGRSLVEIIARPRREAVERLRRHPEVAELETFGERIHVTLHSPGAVPTDTARTGEAAGAAGAADVAATADARHGADDTAVRLASTLRDAGLEVLAARPVRPSLEDAFIARIRARQERDGSEVKS